MEGGKASAKGIGSTSVQLYVKDDCWFVDNENGRFGPFDRIYEICMSTCFLGGSICESRELRGEDMAEFLWPLMSGS